MGILWPDISHHIVHVKQHFIRFTYFSQNTNIVIIFQAHSLIDIKIYILLENSFYATF